MADRRAVRAGRPPRTILSVRLRSGQPGSAASTVRCPGCRTASFFRSWRFGCDRPRFPPAPALASRIPRLVPRAMLYSSEPRSSERPSMRTLMLGCCDRKASSFWTVGTSVEQIPPANWTMSGFITVVPVRHQEFRTQSGRRLGAEPDYALFSVPRHGASWLSHWMEL
jgi:hypothetical protein